MVRFERVLRWLMGLTFLATGTVHFLYPDVLARLVPPYLPWPLALVYLSGVFEIGLGLLLLVPRYSRLAAWGLVALLVAVFPANLHMALHPEEFASFSPVLLWARLPLQALLIAWAYWFTRPPRAPVGDLT